ncbi:MAG: hypothetical protein AB7P12_02980 [Alphaproteobacteria bacterium]
MNPSYFITTAICRTYFFLTATLLGVIGAETWFHVGVMMVAGLAIDVVRNFVVSDLRQPIGQVAAVLSNASAGRMDPSVFRRPNLVLFLITGSYAAYVIAIMIADGIVGSERSNEYFRLWTWLHEAVSPYMQMMGRHAEQIEALGHPYRILIAAHLYAVTGVFIVLTTIIVTSIAVPLMAAGALERIQKGEIIPGPNSIRKRALVIIYAAALGIYWLMNDLLFVEETGAYSWNVHTSNMPFIILCIWGLCVSLLPSLVYFGLIKLRQRAWTGSSAHTNVTAELPHD